MRSFLAALCHAQVPMALSGALFVYSGAALLGRELPWLWIAAAFFGCLYIYLLDASAGISPEDALNTPGRAGFFRRHPWMRTITPRVVIALAAVCIWMLGITQINDDTYFLLGALALLGGLYVVPLIPLSGRRVRLKEFASLKPLFISLAWLMGGLGLPLLEGARTDAGPATWPGLIAGFLLALLVFDSVALDWRDRRGDGAQRLRTLAVQAGELTPLFLVIGSVACALLWLAGLIPGVDPRWLWGGGAMWFFFLNAMILLPRLERSEIGFGLAVMMWRIVGGLALLGQALSASN